MLRKGATGKALTTDVTKKNGYEYLRDFITYGSPAGMPNWGTSGDLSEAEVDMMARYLLNEPASPPEFGMEQIKATWQVLVPVDQRPKEKMNTLDIDNVFSVTLRDTGEVALIDGASKEDRGHPEDRLCGAYFAAVGLRTLSVLVIGRDAKIDQIDLWMDPPAKVASDQDRFRGPVGRNLEDEGLGGQVCDRRCLLAAAICDHGWRNAGAAQGRFDPRHDLRYAGIPSRAARRLDRVLALPSPEFIVNIKETGHILLVDYSDIKNLKTTDIEAERFLHDGGFDSTGRYFLVAANARDRVAVVDTKEGKLVTVLDSGGKTPHPGRGANLLHPKFGPVWVTSHLGDETVSLIGTDPEGNPDHAWKVVQTIPGQGGGSLFVKSHPKSKHLYIDTPLNPEAELSSSVLVYNVDDLTKEEPEGTVLPIGEWSGISEGQRRVVQGEFNKDGDEIWFSVWNGKEQESAIVVVDDKTLKLKHVIKDKRLVTPTGKFNAYNTRHDVY